MRQVALWKELEATAELEQVVNVAQVRQLSPFRYPGGKTWLVPHVRRWFRHLGYRPKELVEPFAGGGIIGLTAAYEQLVDHVVMVELDDQVAAVWRTILGGDVQWLVERIVSFELTPQSIREVLSPAPRSLEEKAFQTILRNRINHGGILAPGAGVFKYGESGKGLRSRWYPRTLRERILLIAAMKNRITFIEGDGLKVLRESASQRETVFFIDPPYTAGGKNAGRRLYTHSEIDHEELFNVAGSLAGDFLMTYEDSREIRAMAGLHGFDMALVAMQNRHHAKMKELLIAKNLGWLRSSPIPWKAPNSIT